MNRYLVVSLAVLAVFSGCKTTNNNSKIEEPIIQTIGNTQVPTSEFAYVYKKNNANADDAYTEKSIREYLDLYTNFKLKVVDAEKAGLDTTKSFERELEVYKKQLAQPYLTEKSVTETLIKEAYERMKEEVNASHILINLAEDAEPKDTLAAYNQLVEPRQRALKGEDFPMLAQQFSQDPSAKSNNGNLGYFTSLQMVYPFEQAAYSTKPGEISMPFRTRFSYHILKVHNRRPTQGQVRVAHIMVRANAGMASEDSLAAKQKVDEIYQRIQKGEAWDKLAAQFSEDNGSKAKGGELPVFGTGSMIPSFEEVAFGLKNPGDIAPPVQTPYGWHIIKLIQRIPLESFENLEPTIKSKVSKDSRSELNRAALLTRLKKENNYTENKANLSSALATADSSLMQARWSYNLSDARNEDVLFTLTDSTYTRGEFFNYVKGVQRPRKGVSPSFVMQNMYNKFVEDNLIRYEEAQLEKKYEDYRMLVKEYRDGILLFQLMDEKVWSKAIEDTLGLRQFFNNNRDKYTWTKRAKAVVYNAASPQVLDDVKKKLAGGIFLVNEPSFADLLFDKNGSEIKAKAAKTLDNVVATLKSDPTLYMDVIGHADHTENGNISGRRARAITEYLVSKGVSKGKLVTKDMEQRAPVNRRASDVKNQRVSFRVYSSSNKALERVVNASAPLSLQVTEGLFQRGENEFVDKTDLKKGQFTYDNEGRAVYVIVTEVQEPRQKTLEEARGHVISDYQTYLEKVWIDNLKKEHPVVVNEREVKKLIAN